MMRMVVLLVSSSQAFTSTILGSMSSGLLPTGEAEAARSEVRVMNVDKSILML